MSENKQELKKGEAPKEPVEGQDFIKFDYADVYFECARCGHLKLLDKGVKDGLSFVLPATDKHEWRMVCDECKNMMRIFFRKSSEATIAAVKHKEEMELKKAEEENKIKENESSKENKKKRSSKRSSKDSERSDGADAERARSADVTA